MLALSPTGNLYSQKQVVSFIQSQRGENIFLSCLRMVPGMGAHSLVLGVPCVWVGL